MTVASVRVALAALVWLVILALIGIPKSYAHDIYTGVTAGIGSNPNFPCCGGNDCEAVDIRAAPNGVEFFAKDLAHPGSRKWVFLPNSRISFFAIPGDPMEKGGHWCGRELNSYDPDPVDIANGQHTYCAFVVPGGT